MIKIQSVFSFFILALAILSLTVTSTILISPLVYKVSITWFQLDRLTGLSQSQLMENYMTIIGFLFNPFTKQLEMPYFSSSQEGLIHFYEVSQLVIINAVFSLISLIVIYAIIKEIKKLPLYKRRKLNFGFQTLISLPIVFLFLIVVSFNQLFRWFHLVLFNNAYWLFDPLKDPVIRVLPQELFMVLFVLAVIIYEGLVLLTRWLSFRR